MQKCSDHIHTVTYSHLTAAQYILWQMGSSIGAGQVKGLAQGTSVVVLTFPTKVNPAGIVLQM